MVFVAVIPVDQLHPHQALTLVNRWAKLKGYWYQNHLEALYTLKDKLIFQWVDQGSMVVNKVIQRESLAIAKMKAEIDSKGAKLEHLDPLGFDWENTLSHADHFHHWAVLQDLVNGEIQVSFPESIQSQLQQAYRLKLVEYEQQMLVYLEAQRRDQKRWLQYQKNFRHHVADIKKALQSVLESTSKKKGIGEFRQALSWLDSGSISDKQAHQIIEVLKKHQISVHCPDGILPQVVEEPIAPEPPILYTELQPSLYIVGSLPEIEAAVDWARSVLDQPHLQVSDINEDWVNQLEDRIANDALNTLKALALQVFEQVIQGELTDSQAIYNALTALPLNYSEAIGMESSRAQWEDTKHREYSRWHEINLSLTGFWLVEFQSKIDPSVSFHIPYDRAIALGFNPQNVLVGTSDQLSFGREISVAEQQDYPIQELLNILGKEVDRLPRKLRKHRSQRHCRQSNQEECDQGEYMDKVDEGELGEGVDG